MTQLPIYGMFPFGNIGKNQYQNLKFQSFQQNLIFIAISQQLRLYKAKKVANAENLLLNCFKKYFMCYRVCKNWLLYAEGAKLAVK